MESKKKNRIEAIDFARGFSVLMMIPVHTMMLFASNDTWDDTIIGSIAKILECGTPAFLIYMGISFAFSSKANTKGIVKKALLVIGLGYLLNFMRFIIPMFVFGGLPEDFMGLATNHPDDVFLSALNLFLKGDIYQLSGISLLLIGLSFKYLIKNKNIVLLLTLVIMWASKIVSGFLIGVPVIDYFLNLLWSNNFDVYFPLFPWLSFVLLGLYFGLSYQEDPENVNKSLFTRILIVGAILLVVGKLLCINNYEYHFGDYYHLGPGGTMWLAGVDLLITWVFHRLVLILPKDNLMNRLFFYGSKNVMVFYFVQWVLIYWIMTIAGFAKHSALYVLSVILIVNAMTFMLVSVFNKFFKKKKSKKFQNSAQQLA